MVAFCWQSVLAVFTLAKAATAVSVPHHHQVTFGQMDVKAVNGVPNMTDLSTIKSLAFMAYNAYYDPESKRTFPVENFNVFDAFGWNTTDTIRGYVYTSADSKVHVISIKGTSPSAFGIGGPTSDTDRLNDNFMFSCCCSHVPESMCGCKSANGTCSRTCLSYAANTWRNSYYHQVLDFVENHKKQHGWRSWIWLTGHSLGGTLAALVATKLRLASVSFESPGDARFAHHLGLVPELGTPEFVKSQEWSNVYHVANTNDPIFYGKCNGYSSSCFLTGYSIQTKCHLGRQCVFDVPHGFCSIDKHRMTYLLLDVMKEWTKETPTCKISSCVEESCDLI